MCHAAVAGIVLSDAVCLPQVSHTRQQPRPVAPTGNRSMSLRCMSCSHTHHNGMTDAWVQTADDCANTTPCCDAENEHHLRCHVRSDAGNTNRSDAHFCTHDDAFRWRARATVLVCAAVTTVQRRSMLCDRVPPPSSCCCRGGACDQASRAFIRESFRSCSRYDALRCVVTRARRRRVTQWSTSSRHDAQAGPSDVRCSSSIHARCGWRPTTSCLSRATTTTAFTC